MSGYVYVVKQGVRILGATTRKYELSKWADKEYLPELIIERFKDGRVYSSSVTFSLKEFVNNPHKQFKEDN